MRLKQTLIILFNLFLFFNCEDKVNYDSNNDLKNLEQSVSDSNNIFLDENNVTIKCHLAEVGDKAIIKYEKKFSKIKTKSNKLFF